MKYLTGIGSRKTPKSLIPKIREISRQFVDMGFILRSGGADSADSFWEEQWDIYGGQKEIYLPWPGFNKNRSPLYGVSDAAMAIAQTLHPKWNELDQPAKLLHGRNVYQVLGYDLKTPSDILICWTPGGEDVGGTATAIRLARQRNIQVINLANPADIIQLDFWVDIHKLWC